jgi:hypothetical protein
MLDLVAPYADSVIMCCNVVLSVGVIPAIWVGRHSQQIPYATSLMFTAALAILAVALLSQGLVLAAVSDLAAVGLWAIVAGERAVQR